MREFFLNVLGLHNREDAIKRTNKIGLMLAWYLLFSTYPLLRSDDIVVRFVVVLTLFLLMAFYVGSFISTAVKYKGALKEMIWHRGLCIVNSLMWIALMTYQLFLCPGPNLVVVAYFALTILIINLIVRE